MKKNIFILCIIVGLIACNSEFIPKPRGYSMVDLPEKKYQLFNNKNYPYSFEYPVYANIIKDSNYFNDALIEDYWINIEFPTFNGKIYLSYKSLLKNNLRKLINDAFELTSKHIVKAASIDEIAIKNNNKASGIYFKLKGDVATANQFFLTDSVKHFLRGSLYFNTIPNEDSLSVVNKFIVTDIEHLIHTLKWKN